MKLPEDKNERNKMLGLIGIGILGLAYVVFTFGLSPFFQKQATAEARITELGDMLWRSKKDIQNAPLHLKQNDKVLTHVLNVSEKKRQILRPSLGNYLLVATDIITGHADAAGLTIDTINTTTVIQNDKNSKPDERAPNAPRFQPYAVNISLNCNLLDLMKLFNALESSNPYLCVTRMGVFNNPDDFEKHAVSFDVEWPIWLDNDMPLKLSAEKFSDEERL